MRRLLRRVTTDRFNRAGRHDAAALAGAIVALHGAVMLVLGFITDPQLLSFRFVFSELWTPWFIVPWQVGLPAYSLEVLSAFALLHGYRVALSYLRVFSVLCTLAHGALIAWVVLAGFLGMYVSAGGGPMVRSGEPNLRSVLSLLPMLTKLLMFAGIWRIVWDPLTLGSVERRMREREKRRYWDV